MSLAEQSQQWFPTSVQVTVHQARSLRVKGKNGTNDAYAIIQVAKDKFSTSVMEKCVAPVWKEEASFDLPLFHPGNAERCTLYITIMHRAQVGLDKFLGQAVINLLNLHDGHTRKKTDWFKLVDKTGKEDKARGEVMLDIQFLRNNMSASMFDLSMQDKPRSRISKLKDKVRGKKKDGFSDSASAIVPSVSQVLTDSEGEADAQSLNQSPEAKKKSKLKTLFAPKSNLQRNISQSMSTLGTLPEKNTSLSGSRSSGLNVDSPEVKKKFKFLGHKRTGSSDSKVSQGPFSLLGRSKQSNSDLNNLCINGSHVYTEDAEPKSGSTLSLNSSGQGSVEDIRKHTSDASADSFISIPVPSYRHEPADRGILEQQRHQEEEEKRQAEERRIAEAKRLEEEKHRAEVKRLQEEEEQRHQEEQARKRRFLEDEAKRKKQRDEEEEERRKREEERKMLEAAENQRLEEERRRVEEQKRQEEASMSERLTSLFGMIRKKEEKKEEVPQDPKEVLPASANLNDSRRTDQPISHHSTNPFEDIPLTSDQRVSSNESPADPQKSGSNQQTPSSTFFLNRTAKVSAVKPRLPQSLDSEPADCQSPSQLCPSSVSSEFTLSSVPSESPDSFSTLHSSLAPANISQSLFGSSRGSTGNLSSAESSPTMADKRRALLPPMYPVQATQAGNHVPVQEIKNPAYVEADGMQQGKKGSLPLPDYETLFPKKRHGVQGQTQWDHIIAEVNQRHRDIPPELLGPEMSVDGPDEHKQSPKSSITQESPATTHHQQTKPVSSKKVVAPAPPKSVISAAASQVMTRRESIETSLDMSKDKVKMVLQPSSAATHSPTPTTELETSAPNEQRQDKQPPTAKPRQKVNGKEPTQQGSVVMPDSNTNSDIQTSASSSLSSMNKKTKVQFAEFDPFPSSDLISKDPWAQLNQDQEVDDLFTGNIHKEPNPHDGGITANDLNKIFSPEMQTDPFASFNDSDSNKNSEYGKKDEDSTQGSPAFRRRNSSRPKKILPSTPHSNNNGSKSGLELANNGGSFYGGTDAFGAEPFTVSSALASSQPQVPEKTGSQAGGLYGGKTLLQAWVSPSEAQPVSAQNSNGGGLALTPRRPHPVKPLSSAESQHPASTPDVKEIKIRDITQGKIKVPELVESGPYTQLTQEELITLVVKQQTDLSRKDAKIVELEEYIDNLLVRVIDEKPSILQALTSTKPV
ncbi:rab11 family-interacting protein 1 isoform X2 [Mastacembelus armatus]|uniref:RAB11 family interacting protein 1 (class I) a n=1 Tax=Mastacembelus armatus TaxID=205130 RepID=A0A3Q3LJY6_9TELE|nr:rab11 family-interacting protein 1-like isoform X2 [Mastacembelus armatus]